jgi:hypothetical protein
LLTITKKISKKLRKISIDFFWKKITEEKEISSEAPLGSWKATGVYFDIEPILNILVPQTGQVPETAGRPFFSLTCFGFFISRDFLHLTQ